MIEILLQGKKCIFLSPLTFPAHTPPTPRVTYCFMHTVKKGSRVSRLQPGCHIPNSPWAGNQGEFGSDIPPGDGKLANLFLRCMFGLQMQWRSGFPSMIFQYLTPGELARGCVSCSMVVPPTAALNNVRCIEYPLAPSGCIHLHLQGNNLFFPSPPRIWTVLTGNACNVQYRKHQECDATIIRQKAAQPHNTRTPKVGGPQIITAK